ncbi:MAG: hypothetical protein SGI73_02960 [Chloroflexota bacterium]|nr:hypothetical protein [Chloroflexota bacterium]
MPIRLLVTTATVPHVNAADDTIFMRVHLPAESDKVTPPPYPVVLLLPDIMCSAASYGWLAMRLAARGFAVVTYDWVVQSDRGIGRLTPGIEFAALDPTIYGTMPSAPAVPAVLTELERINARDILDGELDTHRLILGGHGTGGWLALHNATRRFFLGVTAAFAFAPNALDLLDRAGHEPGGLPVLPSDVPTLVIAASEDGIGTRLNAQFGAAGETGAVLVRRLWDRIGGGHGHAYFMALRGANHFTITHPLDTAAEAATADDPETASGDALRDLLAEIVGAFASGYVQRPHGDIDALRRFIAQRPPLLVEARLK